MIKKITRRDMLQKTAIASGTLAVSPLLMLAKTLFSSKLVQIGAGLGALETILNGCATMPGGTPESLVHIYPKLKGNKIQPFDDGCMVGFMVDDKHSSRDRGGYGTIKMNIGMGPTIMMPPYREMSPVFVRYARTIHSIVNVPEMMIMHDKAHTFLYRDITYDLVGTSFSQLADQKYFREEIETYAKNIAKIKRPIFFSTMQEMNGDWFPWCEDSKNFKKTWRAMHKIFDDNGANEYATWVFIPYSLDFAPRGVESFKHYYPGDEYVDWNAISTYNRGYGFTNKSLSGLAGGTISRLHRRHKDKPLMIAEMGCSNNRSQGRWFKNAFKYIKSRPYIKGAVIWDSVGGGSDHTVNEKAYETLKEVFKDTYFKGIR